MHTATIVYRSPDLQSRIRDFTIHLSADTQEELDTDIAETAEDLTAQELRVVRIIREN
jgi:hypothetical protein